MNGVVKKCLAAKDSVGLERTDYSPAEVLLLALLKNVQSEVEPIGDTFDRNAASSPDWQGFPPFGAAFIAFIAPPTEPTQPAVGAEYAAIRNAVQSVRLAPELTLPPGDKPRIIGKTEQTLWNVIIRNAQFCEMALKLLQSAEETERSTSDDLMFTVLYTQMKYLQDERAALIIQAPSDPTVSQQNSSFTPDAFIDSRFVTTAFSFTLGLTFHGNSAGKRSG